MAYVSNLFFQWIYLRLWLPTSTPESKKITPPLQGELDFSKIDPFDVDIDFQLACRLALHWAGASPWSHLRYPFQTGRRHQAVRPIQY